MLSNKETNNCDKGFTHLQRFLYFISEVFYDYVTILSSSSKVQFSIKKRNLDMSEEIYKDAKIFLASQQFYFTCVMSDTSFLTDPHF